MIIISNGAFKYHLAPAAVEIQQRGVLSRFITCGYPTTVIKEFTQKLRGTQKISEIARLLDREETELDEALVSPLWISEVLIQIAVLVRKLTNNQEVSEWIQNQGYLDYARKAISCIQQTDARVYHYRSGFGLGSVQAAKHKGMVTLCDHTIAHPSVLQFLVDHQGQLPALGYSSPLNPLWSTILQDINLADHVVVNSDFVKQTFVHQGWDPARVHVVYLGVDQNFCKAIPTEINYTLNPAQPLKILFAGFFCRRKGAEILIKAFTAISDLPWQLEIVGNVEPTIAERYHKFLNDDRVSHVGTVPRKELAQHMAHSDVFVFPSLAEGSARVIFEALACGFLVITTPNSGSIVENNVSGFVVPPGDVSALETAIRQVINMDRHEIAKVGHQNTEMIRLKYQQKHYGDTLLNLYHQYLQG
jgi:glycosyltransferase involved in cell wall biosynthesis